MTTSFDKLRNRAFNKRFILMLLVMLMSVTGAWAGRWTFSAYYDAQTKKVTWESHGYSSYGEESTSALGWMALYCGSQLIERWHLGWWESNGSHVFQNLDNLETCTKCTIVAEAGCFYYGEADYGDYILPEDYSPEMSATLLICNADFDDNGICPNCKTVQSPENVGGVYQIKNIGNLTWYADHPDADAKLINDIVWNQNILDSKGDPIVTNAKRSWKPINLDRKNFDGNHHCISGIYLKSNEEKVGFMGYAQNGSVIKNLTIKDSYFEGPKFVGGIVGYTNSLHGKLVISGCHNAATVVSTGTGGVSGGICGKDEYGNSEIKSCLNTGRIKSKEANHNFGITERADKTNCVFLKGTADVDADGQTHGIQSGDLANGTAVLLLNGGTTDGTQIWYQKLGTDALPYTGSKGGDTVYGGYQHNSTTVICSNDSHAGRNLHSAPFSSTATTEEMGGHGYSMENGVCSVCHFECSHDSYTDGVCVNCHYHCLHQYINGFNDRCPICNIDMTNMYEPAPKAKDGFYEVSNGGQFMWVVNRMGSFRLMNDIVVNENVLRYDGTLRDESAIKYRLPELNIISYVTIDGCGHTISGLYGKYLCKWYVYGEIKNIGIIDSYFEETVFSNFFDRSTMTNCFSTATTGGNGLFTKCNAAHVENSYFAGKASGAGIVGVVDCVSILNCYSLNLKVYGSIDPAQEDPSTFTDSSVASKEDFLSGKVAYNLNKGKTDGSQVWYQAIGHDKYPTLKSKGNDTVFRVTDCQSKTDYANSTHLGEGNHYYVDDTEICWYCGEAVHAPQNPEDGYYEISSVGNLYWFKSETDNNPSINGRLMKDIVLNKTLDVEDPSTLREWNGIGEETSGYAGKFDGQGHVIYGLYDDQLFVSLNGATVARVGISDFKTTTNQGILVFVAKGSTIESCYASNALNNELDCHALIFNAINTNVDGCFNYSTEKDNYIANTANRSNISNSYVLENTAHNGNSVIVKDNTNSTLTNCSVKTAQEFASGEITWTLNAGKTDGTQKWFQRLGKDQTPLSAKTDGNTVYHITNCQGSMTYENTAGYEGHVVVPNGVGYACKYCGKVMSSEDDEYEYFALKAVGGSVTIGMKKTGQPDNYVLQFLKSNPMWSTVSLTETTDNIVTIQDGETCYFRHGTQTVADRISTAYFEDFWSFTMDGTGTIEADGNIMSLLDMTCQKNSLGEEYNAFTKLFEGCGQLKKVTINSQALMDVGYKMTDVFGGSVTTYVIGNGVSTIGNGAFNRIAISSITIPEGITSIGENAFTQCPLTSIVIPSTVQSIGSQAFLRCPLTSISIEAQTPPSIGSSIFSSDTSFPIYVPCGTGNTYRKADGWNVYADRIFGHIYDENATIGTPAYYTCSRCGEIDPVRQHVHSYSDEWSNDGTHHWHQCTNEAGECNAPRIDVAEHNIHESNLCDTENYLCDVCQYVDEEKKAQFGERDYMSMTAVGGDMTIGFTKVGTPADYTIQVSQDGNHWSEPQTLTETATLATIPEGETYYFRHDATTKANRISSNDNNYWAFTMEGTGTIEAGGNIMSLLDATCQQTALPGNQQHVFTKLFFNCEKLTVAPRMDAITSVPQWGFVSMFAGSGIKAAPALSATSVPDGAYTSMFENCKELVSVPALPATKLSRCAYWNMFKGCDKLTSIEIANIQSMVVEEGSSGRDNSFHDMLAGTAVGTNGVVIAPIEMMGDTRITLPSNWQWATKLKANEDPDNDGNFYTTFFDSRYDYKVENGFKAYSGIITTTEGDERELRLTATPDKIIPKGDGVLIHGGSGEVLLTVSDGSAKRVDGNVLTGSDTDTTAPANCYILSYGQNGLAFYKYAQGKTLAAHKAYLVYEKPAGAPALRMVFEDEETGIETPLPTSPEGEEIIYNLQGVRLNKLQKGINIVNGKKILVK